MRQEKNYEYSGYISFPMQDFKNLWEFKMACVKRDWVLVRRCGWGPFSLRVRAPAGTWKQRLEEIRELLEK